MFEQLVADDAIPGNDQRHHQRGRFMPDPPRMSGERRTRV